MRERQREIHKPLRKRDRGMEKKDIKTEEKWEEQGTEEKERKA
jgi:hypothetical protein